MKNRFPRAVSMLLCLCMLLGMMPFGAFAAVDYDETVDEYYNVISKDDYELAPGITESEIVLNNDEGTHRQVAHVVEVDLSNPYTKVIPSYKGMIPQAGSYGVQIMSEQAKWAENNGYGNVVAAMNLSLSWYNNEYYTNHPELVGEPLGYMVLDGEIYMNSQGQTSGAQTCVVINFDEKDGVARPEDMPKVMIRSTSDAITGWEEQVIPANFGFLVKDGVNQYSVDNNANNGASRSFVGIKADGTFVMVMNDGRQSPYSAGFTNYEMAEFMLSLGCVQAVNGDGGGSSAFLSQRPGEELKLNCSPSDGTERPTTHGILVISTAPADGQFARASITAEHDYYTPGSTVTFSALGTDLVGTPAEIPEDATWQLADPAMGTIEDGVFVSNGTVGTVTAQMVWNDAVVGEASVEIVIPETLTFSQSAMIVPFGKEVTIGLNATANGGLHQVVLKPEDVTLTTDNDALGTFNGFQFTSVSQENAPENLTSTLTATLVHDTSLVATATLSLGKGSEVLFSFDENIDNWLVGEVNGNDYVHEISHATAANGKVHDGTGSLRLHTNGLHSVGVSAGGYAQVDLYLEKSVIVENAKSIGFWAYIPDEYEHCWIRVLYWYDPDGDGVYDKKNTISVISQPTIYNTADEDGWYYFSVDVSAYESVMITGLDQAPASASKNDANNYRFIEFMFPHTNTNDLWKTYGSINGPYTIYIDNITADYSDAVDDREAPIFGAVNLVNTTTEAETALEKNSIVTTGSNLLNVKTTVAEDTAKTNATGLDASSAKAYVDGVPVDFTYSNGRFSLSDVAVADGVHRVKFEIADMMGNKSVVVRLINVQSGVDASTVQVVPQDETLDRLYGGSLYWMNINATDIETIQSVETVIDLNGVNHWELDHMVLAEGFSGSYTLDTETNTASITITRTGENTQTGEVTLASLPIRIISFDTDMKIEGYTAETFWNEYDFWPQDLKVDVDMGKITYVEGFTSDVLNAFSNEEFSVGTEMYTSSSNMDAAFKAERGTAHVHTAEAMEDQAATCTTGGYTGRTYCNVCASVVDWGTEVSADGHSFTVEGDGLYTCADCGEMYCYIGGEAQTGWVNLDGNDYYFNADGAAVDGEVTIDGHTYTFVDHILTIGSWENDGVGLTCWWAGELVSGGWHTMNGNQYFFTGIYANTGVYKVAISTDAGWRLYIFDENGVWLENQNGLYPYDGEIYYAENGVAIYAGLVQDSEGNYYYINSKFVAVKDCYYTIGEAKTNGLLPADRYQFGPDGKMIDPPGAEVNPDPEEPALKQGLVIDEDGEIRYYVDGVATYAGLVQDAEGNYYYINSTKKAVKNCKYGISEAKANGLLPAGTYEFGADGKMIDPPDQEETPDPSEPTEPEVPAVKQGLVTDGDGEIRYYVDGVATYAGLVQDEDGNYYYINSTKKAVKNCDYTIGEAKANGLLPAGKYQFGPDGKMIDPPGAEVNPDPEEPALKQGLVVDEDGEIRYYVDGVATYAGLVQDAEGNYYYINSTKKAVKDCKYAIGAAKTNGLLPAGVYEFGADGKMINPPAV